MHMKVAEEDRHVEMKADYKPAAADKLTSCGNNSNAPANAWVDDLTQRALQGTLWKFYEYAAKIEFFCLVATHGSRHVPR